jgi:tRNA modification GTPase
MLAPKVRADSETIAGLSTPTGGALNILRLSGPQAVPMAQTLFRGRLRAARRPSLGHVVDPASGQTVDEAMATVFKAPRSFTGEDVVEITCRGGPALAKKVVSLLSAVGARPAQAGEFTRRAVTSGRIDLLRAEGILGMLTATRAAELAWAGALVNGDLSRRVGAAATGVARALQQLEAGSDYPLEESADASVEGLAAGLVGVRTELQSVVALPRAAHLFGAGALQAALKHLRLASDAVDDGLSSETVVSTLLRAREALGRVTGVGAGPPELDAFFARFPAGS